MASPAITLDPTRRSKQASEFANALCRNIVGQDQAVAEVVEVFQTFAAGLHAPGRPIANLLFLGPTGSGKTRVVEAMGQALFGNPRACIKIDCAEFQHSHEIAKLIGSPPGYLGHKETHALLRQETLDRFHTADVKLTLLLFDEIEKASDALWQLLLGVLDKGALTLGDNTPVDLSRCIIIMTSNLGAAEMSALVERRFGFSAKMAVVDEGFDQKLERTAVEAARRKFTPEFMNRIDKVVVFKSLRPSHLERILDLELEMVQQRILNMSSKNKFLFSCTDRAKEFLLNEGIDPKYGARHLKRAIERNLVSPLARLVASAQLRFGDFVRVDVNSEGGLSFTKEEEGKIIGKNELPEAPATLPVRESWTFGAVAP